MKRLLVLSSLYAAIVEVVLILSVKCYADAVFAGGKSYQTVGQNFVLIETMDLEDSSATPITIPTTGRGLIYSAAAGPDGTVFLGGLDDSNNDSPLIYIAAPGWTEAVTIPIADGNEGYINSVAITPDGNAIFVGTRYAGIASRPFACRLSAGDRIAYPITLPLTNEGDQGELYTVTVAPNGVAILAGQTNFPTKPLVYSLSPKATSATLLTNPNAHSGTISITARRLGNTVLLGGADLDTRQALIYSIIAGSNTLSLIEIPGAEQGYINDIAVASDGTAVLGGQTTLTRLPLIYRMPARSDAVSLIANPVAHEGTILSVAMDPKDRAILGGRDDTLSNPLVWSLTAGATQASFIPTLDGIIGSIRKIAVDPDGTAILAGINSSMNTPLIYRLAIGTTHLFPINTPGLPSFGDLNTVAIVPTGLYNINRLAPLYNKEKYEVTTRLNQSGLP